VTRGNGRPTKAARWPTARWPTTRGYARRAMERFDAIVIGGGAMGTAAARSLAERGRSTLLLERFSFGHGLGSSGGPTRIFRYNYVQPEYVAMVRLAAELWRELEDAAGVDLLRTTGGIDVGAAAREIAAAVRASGIPIASVDAREVSERWPAVRFPDGTELYVQDDGGVLRAEATVRAQLALATRAGADARDGVRATGVRPMGDAVEVETEHGETFAAGVAVVAAGAWAPEVLAAADVELPVRPSREQVSYFALDERAPLPTVIERWDDGVHADYVVPDPWTPGAFKVGLHQGGRDRSVALDPEERPPEVDPDRLERNRAYAGERFAAHHATGTVDTCLYTNAPDEDFVIDRVGPIVVASPCSGHGFKFVPLVGRIVADLATDRTPEVPIGRFRLDRPGLRT
jgi:sarcosine oxidase